MANSVVEAHDDRSIELQKLWKHLNKFKYWIQELTYVFFLLRKSSGHRLILSIQLFNILL